MKILDVEIVKSRLKEKNLTLIGLYKNVSTKTNIRCYCGKIFQTRISDIFSNKTKSCGCYNIKHGQDTCKDLINQKFGKLLVINKTTNRKRAQVVWQCLCDCGEYINVPTGALQSGNTKSCGCTNQLNNDEIIKRFKDCGLEPLEDYINTATKIEFKCYCGKIFSARPGNIFSGNIKSCGCLRDRLTSERTLKDLTNKKFGMLTVIKPYEKRTKQNQLLWECKCDCGNSCIIRSKCLIGNNTKSCGCFRRNKMLGQNNHNYNPNLTDENRIDRRIVPEFKKWSKDIKQRDKYSCQVCLKHGVRLHSHHIYNWEHHPDLRYDLENGVCLCIKCHNQFHKVYGRKYNTKEQFEEFKSNFGVTVMVV